MKSFILKLNAEIIDQDNNKVVINQNLVFSGHAPAMHNAIENMGKSFVYGLGVSLSRDIMETQKESERDMRK